MKNHLSAILTNYGVAGNWTPSEPIKGHNGDEYYVITNTDTKVEKLLFPYSDISDECDVEFIDDRKFIFALVECDGMWGDGEKEWCLAFNPVSYWETEKCLWDQHLTSVLETLFDIPEWILYDETMENCFILPLSRSKEEIIEALTKAGLTYSSEMEAWLAKSYQ